jgi:hypothetical protein
MASAAPALTRDGTDGRVYGGDPNLIHVPDGLRREAGRRVAKAVDFVMRAISNRIPWPQRATKLLCPGCYMIVLFNAAVYLAKANGQPLSELGRTMAAAFTHLAETAEIGVPAGLEEIEVILDPCA